MTAILVKKSRVGQFEKGVFANRDFSKGEAVVKYKLKRLSEEEFSALSEDERQFTHVHQGQRYLYSTPERYVNHSPTPNTRQDFEANCDRAIRDIQKGEEITTDSTNDDF